MVTRRKRLNVARHGRVLTRDKDTPGRDPITLSVGRWKELICIGSLRRLISMSAIDIAVVVA